jgi:putative transposase
VSNVYQTKTAEASPTPCVPDQVMISLGEIAESAKEGLLALAVGAGLQVMYAMMDADVAALAGPKGRHQPDRAAVRHGGQDGSVTLGGRRVAVRRPRVRAADGSGEVRVPSYELFAGSEVPGRMAMERMLAGLSTRGYRHGLEPVGERVAAQPASTSRSAVSRRFVAATEHALAELMNADLSTLDLVVLMVDGVHFAEHTCVVALGIDIDGTKHPLALVEGRPRTPPWSPTCCSGCANATWTSPARSWPCWTGPRRCRGRYVTCSTSRSSNAANSTRSEMCGTGCPRSCVRWSSGACARPTTPTRR